MENSDYLSHFREKPSSVKKSPKEVIDQTSMTAKMLEGVLKEDQPLEDYPKYGQRDERKRSFMMPREGQELSIKALMLMIDTDIWERDFMIDYDLNTLRNFLLLLSVGESFSLGAELNSPSINYVSNAKHKKILTRNEEIIEVAPARIRITKTSNSHFRIDSVHTYGVYNQRRFCSPPNIQELGTHSYGAAGGNTINPRAIPRMSSRKLYP